MPKQMYFGNESRMLWVPCPSIEMPSGTTHWVAEGDYLNGGAAVRRSTTGSRRYEMDWNLASEADIDLIESFWEGAWGDGPYYFLDPQAMKTNIFPVAWAQPRVALKDGPKLVYDTKPTALVASSVFSNWGAPTTGVQYAVGADSIPQVLTVPLPEGYTFAIRADQNMASGSRMSYSQDGGAWTAFTSASLTGQTGGSIVRFKFNGTGTTSLLAMQGVIYKGASGPSLSRWISGKGNSGCEFVDFNRTLYSAALDKVQVYAALRETASWQ